MSLYTSYFNDIHEQARLSARQFIQREVLPHISEWEEAGSFPREIYLKAGAAGLLGVGHDVAYGGTGEDVFLKVAVTEEIMRAGSGGFAASLGSLDIALPPLEKWGSQALKDKFVPPVLAGEMIAALAITEPSGGSDVAGIKTRAERRQDDVNGDHYVVNGSKIFITSGIRADFYVAAVRTGGAGHGGISLLLIERERKGVSTGQPLKKMGWWASDTATLHFNDCRVPAENLIGEEGHGFKIIMQNFNSERMGMAAGCTAFARVCLDEAVAYAKERKTFGKPLAQHQVIRHKIVDMAQKVAASQAMLEMLAWRLEQGESPVAEICMMKNQATQTMAFCASEAVQIFGGAGFMRGIKAERIYREVKVNAIGGGTEEIMKDLASRQMGL